MMRLGIVGGGQLARMLAWAAVPLGVQCRFLDPVADACAAAVAEQVCAAYDHVDGLHRLAADADCVTFEFENVPVASLAHLEGEVDVFPAPHALAIARDRYTEKTLFRNLGIETAAFCPVNSLGELQSALDEVGLPAVLKTRTLGYDGKGQAVLRTADDIESAWTRFGGAPLIVETFVPFEREVSIIAVRGRDGETAFYPLTENEHRDGILHLSIPRAGDALQSLAEDYAARLLGALNYVGVLALELFESRGGLLANEFAPRVHNSGHWTIEGAETSQFENHLRAVLGLPLGRTTMLAHSAMVNFVGQVPPRAAVLALPNTHLHLYGKAPRPGRKLGHATLRASSAAELHAGLPALSALVGRETR